MNHVKYYILLKKATVIRLARGLEAAASLHPASLQTAWFLFLQVRHQLGGSVG